jgi:hypothetical protein
VGLYRFIEQVPKRVSGLVSLHTYSCGPCVAVLLECSPFFWSNRYALPVLRR